MKLQQKVAASKQRKRIRSKDLHPLILLETRQHQINNRAMECIHFREA